MANTGVPSFVQNCSLYHPLFVCICILGLLLIAPIVQGGEGMVKGSWFLYVFACIQQMPCVKAPSPPALIFQLDQWRHMINGCLSRVGPLVLTELASGRANAIVGIFFVNYLI